MKLILDLLLLAIIVLCAWTGYKKGLIMGIGSILAIIISIYGANLVSNTFSHDVIPALEPFLSGYMEGQVSETLYENLGYEPDENGEYHVVLSVADLLAENPEVEHTVRVESFEKVGIYHTSAEVMATEAEAYEELNDVSFTEAIVQVLCERATYVICFLLAFVLILILLTVLGNVLNLGFKLPGLDIVNDILGTVFGVATGIFLCVVLVWAIKFTGKLLPEETVQETFLASWFLDKDFLMQYLGL